MNQEKKRAIPKTIAMILAIFIMLNSCVITVFAASGENEEIAAPEEVLSQAPNQDAAPSAAEKNAVVPDVSITVSSQTIHMQTVESDYYIFLPSNADLQAVSFKITGDNSNLKISGNKGETALNGTDVDITALSDADENGAYSITLSGSNIAQITIRVMKSANIPAMYIKSKNAETEGRDFVDASKKNVTSGSMCLIDSEGRVICSDDIKKLKSRGNTTFMFADKKSYQIKLDKKADLVNCGNPGKTWVLLASYFDATQLRDKMFKDLAKALQMQYTASSDWIDLYYDGEYRGTYLVSEKNAVGSNRINITDMEKAYEKTNVGYGENETFYTTYNKYGQKFTYTANLNEPADITGGFLIELNNTQYDEVNGFITAQGVAFNVKSPEFCGKAALTYMSEYYQEFENAVYAQDELGNYTGYNADTGKYFYEYCDLQSLVKMYLIQRFSNNLDGFYSSFFFYKDAGDIMYAGPVWDMETTSGTGWKGTMPATQEFINTRYLATALSRIPEFMNAVKDYYDNTFRAEAMQLIGENGRVAAYAEILKSSSVMNYTMWPLVKVGYPGNSDHLYPEGTTRDSIISDLEKWLQTRISTLDRTLYGHIHIIELENAKAATCTEAGYTGDEVCTACNTVVKQGEAIAALGHKTELRNEKAATCTEAGYTGDEVCTVCNAVVKQGSYTEKLPHTYKDGVCTACGGKDSAYKPPIDNVFADVNENDYFYEAVHWAINHDPAVTTGTDATHFSPEEACTRAQAVTFLWRSAGCPKPTTDTCAFTDVPEDAYYYNAVLWAVENKITTGVSETEFSPDEKATRAQMVTFLYRLEGEPKVENITNGFADVDANEYYYNAVLWAIDKGITNGMDETHFGPSEICNRAHSVTFVFRYVMNCNVKQLIITPDN